MGKQKLEYAKTELVTAMSCMLIEVNGATITIEQGTWQPVRITVMSTAPIQRAEIIPRCLTLRTPNPGEEINAPR